MELINSGVHIVKIELEKFQIPSANELLLKYLFPYHQISQK
jgi:hypothetical protein